VSTHDAVDEARHDAGDDPSFDESWSFDFSRPDGTGGFVRLGLRPGDGVAWYWAYLVTPEHGLVVVRDHEVPLPRAGGGLEIRATSLWAELVCETPMEHWGLGLEAFGVRLDAPGDAYRGEIGERLAVGLDLEWEAYTPAAPADLPDGQGGRYEHAGVVHGDLLIGRDRIEIEATGAQSHAWGPRDWWTWGWHQVSFQVGDTLALGAVVPDESDAAKGWVWRLGDEIVSVAAMTVETHHGPEGIPSAARYVVDHQFEVDVEVLAHAPVPLRAPGGRTARLPRALCRFTTAEGSGTGWCEWLQPGMAVA